MDSRAETRNVQNEPEHSVLLESKKVLREKWEHVKKDTEATFKTFSLAKCGTICTIMMMMDFYPLGGKMGIQSPN